MNVLRLKKTKEYGQTVTYSQGFFGGLLRQDMKLDRLTLRQYFKGKIPDEIEIEVREVIHDRPREEVDHDIRARRIEEKRKAKEAELNDMQIKGAIARLEKKFGGPR